MSSTMRIMGLSGLDTESMVTKLMDAEKLKLNRLTRERQKLVWKQASYRNVSKALKDFQTKTLSLTNNLLGSMRVATNWNNLAASVKLSGGSDTTAVSIKTNSAASAGNYSLKVDAVAKADVYQSAVGVTQNLSFDDVDLNALEAGDSIRVSLDGESGKVISFTQDDIDALNSAQNKNEAFANILNREFAKVFGSDTVSGVQVPKVTASANANGFEISASPGHNVRISESITATPKANTSLSFGDINVSELKKGDSITVLLDGTTSKTISFTEEDIDKLNTATTGEKKETLVSILNEKLEAEFGENKIAVSSTSSGYEIKTEGAHTFRITGLGAAASDDGSDRSTLFEELRERTTPLTKMAGKTTAINASSTKLSEIGLSGDTQITVNGKTIDVKADESIDDFIKKVNDSGAGVKLSFSGDTGKFRMESSTTGAASAISMSGSFLTGTLGLTDKISTAQDARIELNGEVYTRQTNNFTISGITIGLSSTAEGKEFDINVSKDADSVLKMAKTFVEEYNKLVSALNAEYKTSRSKSGTYTYYEPLTDDEKSALTESQIEKIETEAKKGVNYNDGIISDIATQLRSVLTEQVSLDDGSSISLFSIGIQTSSSMSQAGMLVLDEAKFKAAFEERGEDIAELFTKDVTGIAERFNDVINQNLSADSALVQKSGLENSLSALTNDMYLQIKSQDDKISDMRALLLQKENNYYSMFSKLETALTQANSQASSLQAMLGF